jgi:hypothetical protein
MEANNANGVTLVLALHEILKVSDTRINDISIS